MKLAFLDLPIKDFLNKVSSSAPTPGGGSVSALSGSLGLSLLSMVLNLTLKKLEDDEEMKKLLSETDNLREKMMLLIEEDAKAFDKVMSSFSLPKETDEEKKERSKAIQDAFKGAAEVPYQTAEICEKASEIAVVVAEKGEKNAISDVGCAVWLLRSAFYGAKLNVDINLSAIKDEGFVSNLGNGLDKLLKTLEENLSKALNLVKEGL